MAPHVRRDPVLIACWTGYFLIVGITALMLTSLTVAPRTPDHEVVAGALGACFGYFGAGGVAFLVARRSQPPWGRFWWTAGVTAFALAVNGVGQAEARQKAADLRATEMSVNQELTRSKERAEKAAARYFSPTPAPSASPTPPLKLLEVTALDYSPYPVEKLTVTLRNVSTDRSVTQAVLRMHHYRSSPAAAALLDDWKQGLTGEPRDQGINREALEAQISKVEREALQNLAQGFPNGVWLPQVPPPELWAGGSEIPVGPVNLPPGATYKITLPRSGGRALGDPFFLEIRSVESVKE